MSPRKHLHRRHPICDIGEEKVLERYELLYEAGLVEEAARDGRLEVEIDALASAVGHAREMFA